MHDNELDKTLYPQIELGSKVIVWCLEFPPERRGDEIWTRLLEEVEIEIIAIGQFVLGKDAAGREFHTLVALQFKEKNRIIPSFIVPDSIKVGGGSPEWWTPECFRRSGWNLIDDEFA